MNVGLLMNGTGELVMDDVEKIKVLNVFSVSAFTNKAGVWKYQAPETEGKVWSKDTSPSLGEN